MRLETSPIQSRAAAVAANAAPPRQRERSRMEIVWRETPGREATRAVPLERVAEFPPAPSRSSHPIAAAPNGEAGRESSQARPAVLRLRDLEPGLLDRLTDDVIRRVERRARIERERRGL